MRKYVIYFRVSTAIQGVSGLGIEEQKRSVKTITDNGNIIASFTEYESGKNNKRVEIKKAIDACKLNDATLVVARLDRLSRRLSFIVMLRDSEVKFICADDPNMTNLTINIKASVAEEERENISRNTKRGLSTIKHNIETFGYHVSKKSGRTITKLGNQIAFDSIQEQTAYYQNIASKRTYEKKSPVAQVLVKSLAENGKNESEIMAKLSELGISISRRTLFNYKR